MEFVALRASSSIRPGCVQCQMLRLATKPRRCRIKEVRIQNSEVRRRKALSCPSLPSEFFHSYIKIPFAFRYFPRILPASVCSISYRKKIDMPPAGCVEPSRLPLHAVHQDTASIQNVSWYPLIY